MPSADPRCRDTVVNGALGPAHAFLSPRAPRKDRLTRPNSPRMQRDSWPHYPGRDRRLHCGSIPCRTDTAITFLYRTADRARFAAQGPVTATVSDCAVCALYSPLPTDPVKADVPNGASGCPSPSRLPAAMAWRPLAMAQTSLHKASPGSLLVRRQKILPASPRSWRPSPGPCRRQGGFLRPSWRP